MNGWIKLHTKFLNSSIWQSHDNYLIQLFTYCLLEANWKDKKVVLGNEVIELKRGQFITGRKSLVRNLTNLKNEKSKEFKKMAILYYRKLQILDKLGFIDIKSTNKYSIITIKKYNDYQDNVQQKNNSSTTDVQRMYTTEEDEEDEEDKDIILADKPQVTVKLIEKRYERKPPDKQTELQRICYLLEDELKTQIVNWGKQAKALDMMKKAGYTEKQIIWVIQKMAREEEFYRDKGFDLMTVANSIAQFKARARKETYVQRQN